MGEGGGEFSGIAANLPAPEFVSVQGRSELCIVGVGGNRRETVPDLARPPEVALRRVVL